MQQQSSGVSASVEREDAAPLKKIKSNQIKSAPPRAPELGGPAEQQQQPQGDELLAAACAVHHCREKSMSNMTSPELCHVGPHALIHSLTHPDLVHQQNSKHQQNNSQMAV